jgi:hypothetical protein
MKYSVVTLQYHGLLHNIDGSETIKLSFLLYQTAEKCSLRIKIQQITQYITTTISWLLLDRATTSAFPLTATKTLTVIVAWLVPTGLPLKTCWAVTIISEWMR